MYPRVKETPRFDQTDEHLASVGDPALGVAHLSGRHKGAPTGCRPSAAIFDGELTLIGGCLMRFTRPTAACRRSLSPAVVNALV